MLTVDLRNARQLNDIPTCCKKATEKWMKHNPNINNNYNRRN